MIRKTIKTLEEMPDSELLAPGIAIPELQKRFRTDKEDRKARLFLELASISKRFINEGVAFEEVLSGPGMINVSAAIYALQWSDIYYAAEAERMRKAKLGYWRNLYNALLNK